MKTKTEIRREIQNLKKQLRKTNYDFIQMILKNDIDRLEWVLED